MNTPTMTTSCPSCGESSPAGHRFCMRCGVALPTEAQALRAQLTAPTPAGALTTGAAVPVATAAFTRARRFSPAMFGAILLCLLLPFVTISCKYGGPDVTFSGAELIVGKTVDDGNYQQHVDGLPEAAWILVAAIAGLATSFLKPARLAFLPALAGLAGAAVMLWVRQSLIVAAEIQGGGQFVVDFGIGFQLAQLIFVIAAVVNGVVAVQALRTSGVSVRSSP